MANDAYYQAIVENFPNGIVALFDHQLRYTVFNGEGVKELGLRPSDVEGKRLRDLFPPEIYERDEPALLAALRGETTENWVDYGGQHFRVMTVPVRNSAGEVIQGMVMTQNVTEAVVAQDELRASNAKLELAVSTAQLGIWELDLATERLEWNDRLSAIYGLSSGDVSGTIDDFRRRVHREDLAYVDQRFKELAETGRIDGVSFRVVLKGGVTRHVLSSGAVRSDESGAPIALIGINIDVTHLKQAEEERRALDARLRQNQKLEALGALSGGVAHDLNNLLQVIIGQTEEATSSDGESQQAALRDVMEAGERAKRLVSQLLNFGRREMYAPERIDLHEAIRGSLNLLKPLLSSDLELRFVPGAHTTKIMGELSGVEQVLMNLCLNARDAMSEGGTVTIATRSVTEGPSRFIELVVTDTGVGIPEEHKERVFDPFFSTKPPGLGTGLGLATVYGIAKRHGATVSIESSKGKGTSITTRWPAASEDAGVQSIAKGAQTEPRGRVVILADDDRLVRSSMARFLRTKTDFEVVTAKNGREALEAYAARSSDVAAVIMDIQMPEMNGVEAFQELQSIRADLPVIFISGYHDQELEPHLSEHVRLLEKPFPRDALRLGLQEVINAAAQPRLS